jgi:hypothetical protein
MPRSNLRIAAVARRPAAEGSRSSTCAMIAFVAS